MIDLWSDLKNDNQEKAIKAIDGPQLIIAGPGSGKTKVLIRRYLHMILNKNIPPENILLCTFTEKATNEIKVRAYVAFDKHKIPYDEQKVRISTIHSFCNQFIKDNLDKIPFDEQVISPNFHVLDENEQIIYVFSNLVTFGVNEEEAFRKGWKWAIELCSLFNKCVEERINPEDLQKYISSKDLEETKKQKWMLKANAFKLYEKLLKKNKFMDFSHLQKMTLSILEENPEILESLQKELVYVMVDEFQDTNYLQFQIMSLICGAKKNLMVVGDDDQSIYGFRGAVIENIIDFEQFVKEKWGIKDMNPINIKKNYRTVSNIIDINQSLIKHNDIRLEKINESEKDFNILDYPIWFHGESDDNVAELVAYFINKLIDEKIIKNYSNIALLFRSVKGHALRFITELRAQNIPIDVIGSSEFFEHKITLDLINIAFFLFGSEETDIERNENLLNNYFVQFSDVTENLIRSVKINKFLMCFERAQLEAIGVSSLDDLVKIEKLKEINTKINEKKWKKKYRSMLAQIYDIFDVNNTLRTLVDNIQSGDFYILNLISKITQLVSHFDNFKNDRHLSIFLKFFHAIKREQSIDIQESTIDDAVTVCTIHQAKGLEWPIVIVGSMVERKSKKTKFEFLYELIAEKRSTDEGRLYELMETEERRIFYVAFTRTKYILGFSTSDILNDSPNKSRNPSQFLLELEPKIDKYHKISSKGAVDEVITLLKPNKSLFTVEERIVEKPIYSYTQLKTYIQCPRQYLLLRDLKLATVQIGQLTFGSNVHTILEHMHKYYVDNKTIDQDIVDKIFTQNWQSFGFLSPSTEENMKNTAKKYIDIYYNDYRNQFDKIYEDGIEMPFFIDLGDCYFQGVIDLVYYDEISDYLEILDFKAGKENIADDVNKLQLQTYAMAYYNYKGEVVDKLYVHNVSNNIRTDLPISKSIIKTTEDKIKEIVVRINNKEFPKSSGSHCVDCAYKKYCN